MKVTFSGTGDFERTMRFLTKLSTIDILRLVEAEVAKGVKALADATPEESGRAAASWDYQVKRVGKSSLTITWTNSDIENGFPVVVMIQYGHGTGTGGYVQGIDFINPTMRPIFDKILENVWKAVKSA